jgi:hypothetical protein
VDRMEGEEEDISWMIGWAWIVLCVPWVEEVRAIEVGFVGRLDLRTRVGWRFFGETWIS